MLFKAVELYACALILQSSIEIEGC